MILSFRSHLLNSPFPASLIAANLQPAVLETEADFAAYAAFARRTWAPVLLSFAQKHTLMKSVVDAVWRHLDGGIDLILMNCRVPAGGRMAHELGDARVFLVAELAPEVQRLRRAGRSFVTIDEALVRHPMEAGDNHFDLHWHLPGADALQRFTPLTYELAGLGLTQALLQDGLLEVA
ncbi:hypothetical protein ACT2FY_00730 [Paraburkholderia fungorum]|uniref:hypothetical protein n=1 Tax=Paraburkholderia fungorum TaxID=134537 RepID=UPI00402B49EF